MGEPPSFSGSNQSKFIVVLVLDTKVGSCGGDGSCAAIILSNRPDGSLSPTELVAIILNAYI